MKISSPNDILNDAKSKNVPGFVRVEVRCCYHCRWMMPQHGRWSCEKYNVDFGEEDNPYSIALQDEFVCDSWETMKSAE